MELRVEVDGDGRPKALAELPSMRKDPRWHVTLALNIIEISTPPHPNNAQGSCVIAFQLSYHILRTWQYDVWLRCDISTPFATSLGFIQVSL